MPGLIAELPREARVLLVRLRSLGDCVLTTPAIALLKQFRPDLVLAVQVEQRFAGVYEGNPDVNEILAPTPRAAAEFRPSLTLNLHGGSRSAVLTAASLARWRAGFQHYRFQPVYNIAIPRAQEILGEERTVHTAEHVASAFFHLGVPRQPVPRAFLQASPPERTRPYAVLHPFASAPEKAWPAEKFLQLASRLRDHMEVVVIGAAQDDFAPFDGFEILRGAELSAVKSLLSAASLFVGNDSGPAHMAAAFGVPVAVLYGTSDPVVWAPWRTRSESIIGRTLALVTTEEVWQRVERLMEAPA